MGFVITIMLLFAATPVYAMDPLPVGVPTAGVPLFATPAVDPSDQKRIEKLSPADLKQFESKLRKATALFFDHHYRLAIPLFEEIATRVDTLDVLRMYGLAAYRSGFSDLAIAKFQTLLERQPTQHKIRIELALAFLQKGDIDSAEKTLSEALAVNPPKEIQDQIDRLLATIKRRDKQFFALLRASVGVQYDDNISAQTDDLPVGFTETSQLKGLAYPLAASVDTLFDFRKSGLVWRNQLSLYRIDYDDRQAFDFSQVDVRTGLERRLENLHLSMPVGFIHREYGHDSLSNGWYLAPEGRYSLQEGVDLKVAYRMDNETYTQDSSFNQDHTTHAIAVGPSWRLPGERLKTLSLMAGLSSRNAEGADYSYDDWKISPSYFGRFGPEMDAFVQAEYLDRRYDGNSVPATIFVGAPDYRADKRFSLMVVLSKTFGEIYSISPSFTYLRNDSNTAIYDYDKHVIGLNFGVILD